MALQLKQIGYLVRFWINMMLTSGIWGKGMLPSDAARADSAERLTCRSERLADERTDQISSIDP